MQDYLVTSICEQNESLVQHLRGAESVIFWDWELWLTSPDTTLMAISRMHSKTKSVVGFFSMYMTFCEVLCLYF